jgi:hypothetical protein
VKVRFGPVAFPVVVALAVASCGSEDSSVDVSSVVIESDADEVTGATETDAPVPVSSDADRSGDGSTVMPMETPTGMPTGQLTLDGETFELTFDAADPDAVCQRLPGNSIVATGMRTSQGNRVHITVQDVPRDIAMATYFGDDEVPLWSAATDGSSSSPEWSVDGTTVQLTGKWFNVLDTTLAEVDGEIVVTC